MAHVEETGSTFYGLLAGHGPHAQRQILTFVSDLDSKYLSADRPSAGSIEEITMLVGSFVDLWIILRHKEVIIAILFWIRQVAFNLRSPTVIVTSAKMATLLLGAQGTFLAPFRLPPLEPTSRPSSSTTTQSRSIASALALTSSGRTSLSTTLSPLSVNSSSSNSSSHRTSSASSSYSSTLASSNTT